MRSRSKLQIALFEERDSFEHSPRLTDAFGSGLPDKGSNAVSYSEEFPNLIAAGVLAGGDVSAVLKAIASEKSDVPTFEDSQLGLQLAIADTRLEAGPQAVIGSDDILAPQAEVVANGAGPVALMDTPDQPPEANHPVVGKRARRHNLHKNDNAIETLGGFALDLYKILLVLCGCPYPQCMADCRTDPLVIKISSAMLINIVVHNRAKSEDQVCGLTNGLNAHPAAEHAGLDRLCDGIDTALKHARAELSAKLFAEMSVGDSFTHEAIEYRIFLPLAVHGRQLEYGAAQWRKGGGGGRVLVDAYGNDLPRRLAWWASSADNA